jgi:PAS domain-containing protein
MQGASLWVEDIHTDPRFASRDAVKTDHLATGWGVPVRVGNQIIAVVEFFSRKVRREDAELMAPVETVCASIGQFLARSAQEKRVTELNRQKESILNTVADGILGTDQHGRVTFANPAAAAMLGASANALIGRFVHAIVHEDVLGSPAARGIAGAGSFLSRGQHVVPGRVHGDAHGGAGIHHRERGELSRCEPTAGAGPDEG